MGDTLAPPKGPPVAPSGRYHAHSHGHVLYTNSYVARPQHPQELPSEVWEELETKLVNKFVAPNPNGMTSREVATFLTTVPTFNYSKKEMLNTLEHSRHVQNSICSPIVIHNFSHPNKFRHKQWFRHRCENYPWGVLVACLRSPSLRLLQHISPFPRYFVLPTRP